MISKTHLIRIFILVVVLFFSLGCFSMSYFVDMDNDASGNGMIYHSLTFPDIGEKGASSFDSYIERLNNEGWEKIEISSAGNDLLQLTAEYKIDPASGRGFPESMKNFSLKVEEAENGYKYFTMNGAYDYTQLSEMWTNLQKADSGFTIDLGQYFGGEQSVMTKEEIDAFVQRFGSPKVEFKIKLPGNTPVEAKGTWRNLEDYLNGKTDVIEFVWTPDKRPTGTLHVSRRWEPKTEVSQEDIQNNLQNLFYNYQQEIPIGWNINILEMPTGGWFNNLIFAHFNNEIYTCGSYQNYVMDFLDRIRTSPDTNVRNMLNGLDYGPIQTNGGGHVAVVVYPSGTDWLETGTVFDPWPTQKPQIYDIDTWFVSLGLYAYGGYYPEVSFGMENAYPHLSGGLSSYPAQADLDRHRAEPIKQILVINSPVTVMLKMEDGSLVGVEPNGNAINQTPVDVSFYSLPKENGEHSWFFLLPDQVAEVYVYGQNAGMVHMALVSQDKILGFEPQQIHSGESFTFSIQPDASLSRLQLESGETAEPSLINRENFLKCVGVENSDESNLETIPQDNSLVPETSYDDGDANTRLLGAICIGLCCCFVIIVVVVVTILVVRKHR